MTNKILFELESRAGGRQIEQDGDCLVFHIWDSHEHRVQVWSIKTIKEALAKAEVGK